MNRLAIARGLSLAGGVVGYAAGVAAAYSGRAFSVTAMTIGVTLLAMRNVPADGDGGQGRTRKRGRGRRNRGSTRGRDRARSRRRDGSTEPGDGHGRGRGDAVTVEAVLDRDAGVRTYDDVAAARDAAGTTRVRTVDADAATMESVASAFDLHPLAVEDVRPKTERFTGYTFVPVKAAELGGGETTFEEEVRERPIGPFVGDDWLVSLAPGADAPLKPRPAQHRV
jgi:hypothetical protein